MKKVLYIGIGLAVLGLIGFILTGNKKKNEAETAIVAQKNTSISVKADTIKSESVTTDFIANGSFAPLQELSFSAENAGRVTKVLVKEGSVVRIGQTLAIIKGDKLSVDVQSAKATYQNALADNQRFENAFKTGGVTKQQVDQAKLALSNAKAQLDQANISFGDATIRATINGIVNKKYIEPGSVVAPGTQLFDLVNVSKLKLKVTVNENQVASLKVGSTIKVKASVYPDKEFSGKITFIAPMADESLNFPLEIEIANNANNDLKAGMYGTAHFETNATQKTPIKIVPRTAFVGSVSNNQVFVVKDSIAKLTKIVSGRIFGEKVEVLEGLNEGDVVVTSGQINLTDGAKVGIVK
ncbi:RND family efflux transporter MFP subunit [Flavobacterium arsenatis]|uniref:RND family efflux transporter MFP subunit n=1 Tax=Flavobacterium arsenatis TaxID=1484332 RepID=A0ABU1TLJ8_9FLAO|nr:efflux RND transporter periplasmic adaptor subunit [Flavobacterium arsenatis]MDR6966738.1 RND family efflux transporter MFP subunit [Flavobacterium arsenatis]